MAQCGNRNHKYPNHPGPSAVPPVMGATPSGVATTRRDSVAWRCSASRMYSTSSAYSTLLLGQPSLLGAKEIWKAKAPRERQLRHSMESTDLCSLCDQLQESIDHLIASCVMSREVLFKILWHFDWLALTPS
jgi:hypothetical protein